MSKSLKQAAQENPTLLGDPTSIKSETREIPNPDDDSNQVSSPSSGQKGKAATDITKPQNTYASSHAPVMAPAPTEADLPSPSPSSQSSPAATNQRPTLKQRAEQKLKENPTALGDPVSRKTETSTTTPTKDEEGGASGKTGGDGEKERERGEEARRKEERWKRVSKI